MNALDGWIDIARAGTWTDMSGRDVALTESTLDALASAYTQADDAPVVVGHPEADAPAYAWVDGLRRVGDRLQARLRDIEPAFRAAVESGRYAGRSIKFHGARLIHLGFLGGAAPAIDGLAPTRFAADPAASTVCLTTDETADDTADDRVLPGREIAKAPEGAAGGGRCAPATPDDPDTHDDPDTPEEETLPNTPNTPDETDPAALAAEKAALETRAAEMNERETALAAREAAAEAADRLRRADAALAKHVEAGRVLPAERAGLAALLAALPDGDDARIAFAAPHGGEVRETPAAILERLLAALPARVVLGEMAGPGDTSAGDPGDPGDINALARAARNLMAADESGTLTIDRAVREALGENKETN